MTILVSHPTVVAQHVVPIPQSSVVAEPVLVLAVQSAHRSVVQHRPNQHQRPRLSLSSSEEHFEHLQLSDMANNRL